MIKVMFICHGNICRSTMAQSVFSHIVNTNAMSSKFLIDSSATSREEIGNPPHIGTKRILEKNNIKLVDHRAKQITNSDASNFDYLICMDQNNVHNLKRLINRDYHHKISLLLDYPSLYRDIRDPWYTNNFHETYFDVHTGCTHLYDYLIKNHF